MPDHVHDLTETWHGRFSFARLYEPVSFIAHLEHAGDDLCGTIEEPGLRLIAAGKTLRSTIEGHVTERSVSFLKSYVAPPAGYRVVHHVGGIRDEGLEIAGIWSIPGNWSGTFIMICSRGLPIIASAQKVEQV